MALYYATPDELREYMGVTVGDLDDEEATRLLTDAEKDVDRMAGKFFAVQLNGRRFGEPAGANLLGLDVFQVERVRDATCAQAEYRRLMGEDFFVESQPASTQGPDFTEEGRAPKYGPKARDELSDGGLMKLTGRMR